MSIVFELIAAQQKGHENDPVFMLGEQLKDIAEREPFSAELLEKDLVIEGMGLADMAKKLQEYADKHHGSARCYCITPIVAEKLIREFYGLPEANAGVRQPSEQTATILDLSSFL